MATGADANSAPTDSTTARKRKMSLTAKSVIIVCIFIMLAGSILAVALVNQSGMAMRQLINERMLDIANTAAASVNGDELERLTADDKGTREYQDVMNSLTVFQENIDLEYIYCIQRVGEREFAFSVDPTVDDPGEFGEPVTYTDALYQASQGTPAVDAEPYEDAWGKFYSAYCPVFDSAGNVAGVVAVDFKASWYDQQIYSQVRLAAIIGIAALLLGCAIVLLATNRLRRRFAAVSDHLAELAGDVRELTEIIDSTGPGFSAAVARDTQVVEAAPRSDDEIDAIADEIKEMHATLRARISHLNELAYIDALTGFGNRTAYDDRVAAIDEAIDEGTASFAAAVLDVDGLKQTNDKYGHEKGDAIILDAAHAILEAFEFDDIFRIGGDEFVALAPDASQEDMDERFASIQQAVETINQEDGHVGEDLSISKGYALFDPAEDTEYQAVFNRADAAMYEAKRAHYAQGGDRRQTR